MKKESYNMLESKVGNSTISPSSLKHFLRSDGFTDLELKAILKKYFSPTINAYVLKTFENER
jgi:hypothetical protein